MDPLAASSSFQLDTFRCDQSYAAGMTAKAEVTTIGTTKPNKQAWVFIYPDDTFRFTAIVFAREADRQLFLLDQETAASLPPELTKAVRLCLFTTRSGGLSFWPVPLPRPDGMTSSWVDSANDIMQNYAGQWINVRASMDNAGYIVTRSPISISEPLRPDRTLEDLLRVAFRGRIITSQDHTVLRSLRGEV